MGALNLTDPTNGTTADATLIATNNAAIKTVVNGGLDNSNINASAAIAASKLAAFPTDAAKVLAGDGTWPYPPGHEFDYAQVTTNQTSTATSTATATAIVTGNAVTYDGSTAVLIEFFVAGWQLTVTTQNMLLSLYDGSTELGVLTSMRGGPVATQENGPLRVARRLTPSAAAHTYSIRASVTAASTATFEAGAGTIGVLMPMYMRITKAT